MALLVAGILRLCADEASTHPGVGAHAAQPACRPGHDRFRAAVGIRCRRRSTAALRVVPDDHGGIAHAQLSFGHGMIMLGSTDDSAWGQRIVQPQDIGGRESQCPCLIVADCDAHYARARAAGAVVVDPLESKDYGGKGYSCRDPEGHLWWFGSYDPWA